MEMQSFNNEDSLFQVMASSIGFMLVALLATLVGYMLSAEMVISDFSDPQYLLSFLNKMGFIGVFLLLLWPYYYCRQALLERRQVDKDNKYDFWAKTVGFQPYILLLVYSIIISFLIMPNLLAGVPAGQRSDILLGLIISLTPFLLLMALTVRNLKRPGDDDEFGFVERVLYPALATGIVSFSFGWALARQPMDLIDIVVASGYMVILILVAYFFKSNIRIAIPILVFLLGAVAKAGWNIDFLDSVLIGTLITLAMGVAEAAKRYYLASNKERYFAEEDPEEYYLGGSNWSSVVFPFLFVMVPLLVLNLPTWPMLIFIGIQSLTWTFFQKKHKKSWPSFLYTYIVGFGLPIAIMASQFFELPLTIIPVQSTDLTSAFGFSAVIISIGGLVFVSILKVGEKIRKFSQNMFTYKNYIHEEYPYFLLIIILILTLLIVYGIAQFGTSVIVVKQKAIEIIIFIDILLAIVGIWYFINYQTSTKEQTNNDNMESENNGMFLTNLQFTVKTSRPVTSFVAGFTVFFILAFDKQYPIYLDVIQSLPIILATMTGFILNDIYDYDNDVKAKLDRPIAKGYITRIIAIKYAIFFSIIGIIISKYSIQYSEPLKILLITLIGVTIYSPFKQKYPIIKGLFTSILTITPIIYAEYITTTHLPLYLYIAVLIFNIGREVLIDTEDFERDKATGLKTVVYYLGTQRGRFLAWTLMFLGVIFFRANVNHPISIVFSTIGLFVLGLGLILELRYKWDHTVMTKLTMLFCILAIPFSM